MLGSILSMCSKFKFQLILAGLILILLSGWYLYYYYSQAKITTLISKVATLEQGLEIQRQTIVQLNEHIISTQKASDELSQKIHSIELDSSELSKLLSRHDLTNLATKKPKLVETRINNASKDILKELEIISQP